MSLVAKAGKTVVLGTLAAAFGVGAMAGVVAERAIVGRALRKGDDTGEPFGTLHSTPREVVANDGVKLIVEVEDSIGGHDDITVVFVHGYALRQDEYHYQRRDLRNLARMVFYDNRGHGKSEIGDASSHTIAQLALDLETVINEVAPTGKVVLVGHSMGGMTIQALAGLRPELFGPRIKAVILACTSSGGVTEVPLGLPESLGRFVQKVAPMVTSALAGKQEIVDRSREAGNDLTLLLTRRYSFGSGVTPELTQFVAELHASTPIEVVGNFLHAFSEYDSKNDLPTLGQVKTVIVGARDDLMTPISHSEEIAALIPHSELIILPETGHMLPLERYLEFNEIITSVVERVRNS
jgi:pimeloyl-ACP methyl ester carboxylesterase